MMKIEHFDTMVTILAFFDPWLHILTLTVYSTPLWCESACIHFTRQRRLFDVLCLGSLWFHPYDGPLETVSVRGLSMSCMTG